MRRERQVTLSVYSCFGLTGPTASKPERLRTPPRGDKYPSREQRAVMIFRQFHPDTVEYEDALQLREDVLRTPLGLSLTPNDLTQDIGCFHLGGFEDPGLLAVLLLQPVDDATIQMRQVAVLPALRGTGVGSQCVAFAEEFARQRGYHHMIAHARGTALGFFLRVGYAASGEESIEMIILRRLINKGSLINACR